MALRCIKRCLEHRESRKHRHEPCDYDIGNKTSKAVLYARDPRAGNVACLWWKHDALRREPGQKLGEGEEDYAPERPSLETSTCHKVDAAFLTQRDANQHHGAADQRVKR